MTSRTPHDQALPATDFERYGMFAVCHPDSENPTISSMKRPDDVFASMTENEAEQVFNDLDDAIAALK